MADYAWERLSPRQFEHIVQALTVRYFGATALIWGDGPDGGREATFEGLLRDPCTGEEKTGYLVVQAKFLQRPHPDTAAQQAWAARHLRSELSAYEKSPSRRIPDAYIYATNAVLSPSSGGGKDKVVGLLAGFRERYGLLFAVPWDYDQLGAMLDESDGLSTKYRWLITPGELLHATLRRFNSEPILAASVPAILQRELVRDSAARLTSYLTPRLSPTSVASVYVDVPVRLAGTSGPVTGYDDSRYALHQLLTELTGATKVVVTGGPGQGKTTLVQTLAQVHRAALLDAVDPQLLSPAALQESSRVAAALRRLALPMPGTARFPFWVDAVAFAEHLEQSQEADRSVWHFLARRYATLIKTAVDVPSLRQFAYTNPTLLIIDGYDEMAFFRQAATAEHIAEFLDDVRMSQLDTAIVVTSRPQSYEKDLERLGFKLWQLEPLGPIDAISYAEQLIAATLEDSRLLERFRTVAFQTEIRDLLYSPLHVSLILSLLDGGQDLPRERYNLFAAYYDHVYQRERMRGGELGKFLDDFRPLIDVVHQRAAFVLQLSGESDQRSNALSLDRFRAIVHSSVEGAAPASGNVEAVVEKIIRFARQRLVLLVGVDSDTIGFQIRPLAEFLAASHLLRGTRSRIAQRLRAVSRSAYWRDVCRFLAAAIFSSEDERIGELRDTVVVAYQELDHRAHSGVEALRGRGLRLAIDLVADSGLSVNDPYFHHFWPSMEQTTELWTNDLKKLAYLAVAAPASEEWLSALAERVGLSRTDEVANDTCWELLNLLAKRDFRWSAEAARALLDQASPEQLTWMLPDVAVPQVVDGAALAEYLARSNPHVVRRSSFHEDPTGLPSWGRAMWSILHGTDGDGLVSNLELDGTGWPLSGARSIDAMAHYRDLRSMPAQAHAGWHDWYHVTLLCADAPHAVDASGLAGVVEVFHGRERLELLPWPFVELRLSATNAPQRLDFAPWLEAENRWMEQGVTLIDVEAYVESGALTERIRHEGFPFSTLHWCLPGSSRSHTGPLRTILDILHRAQPDQFQRRDTVAGVLLLPICDHELRHGGEGIAPDLAHRVLTYAVGSSVTDTITCPTAVAALSACTTDHCFRTHAERVTRWSWISGEDHEQVEADRVLRRAGLLAEPTVLARLCTRIAARTSNSATWQALHEVWLGPGQPAPAPLQQLLGATRPATLTDRDLHRALRSCRAEQDIDLWDLFSVISRNPAWDQTEKLVLRDRLALLNNEPWVLNSSVYLDHPTLTEPIIGRQLPALGLGAPGAG
ncbi:NACHT domain-containing protein [Micromonospora haikouensis]|uniref:NACHT domain-containing protein n=1 Tax=Micromonospora haikouensis TaxID=686309 RepID=A0A0D0VWZ1_9ACTN|nr:NACHT domain-containing protein [Micromonospora haikouensis]KIR65248.1 hypothetical protein TK50_07175 [Micromonospora haikouensis]